MPGPYHSQNTEAWFYRTPGLKIVVPSTPHDARGSDGVGGGRSRSGPLLRAHRALSRSAHQAGARPRRRPAPIPLGRAALRRAGDDLAIVSYGAYVHVALRVADRLAGGRHRGERARSAERSLPLDRAGARSPSRATATGCSSCTRIRGPAASARASPRSSRKRRSNGSTRRCASSARSTPRCRIRRRSRSSILPERGARVERAARLLGRVLTPASNRSSFDRMRS